MIVSSIGFTGSQKGMTPKQSASLELFLRTEVALYAAPLGGKAEFHHGDCIGADESAHILAESIMLFKIIGHPMNKNNKRAFMICDDLLPAKPAIMRNRDIVDASDILVACPDRTEYLRSGTWSTVRYALKKNKPVVIIWPNGIVERDYESTL